MSEDKVSVRRRLLGTIAGDVIKGVIREKSGNTETIPLETNEKILSDVAAFYAAKDFGKLFQKLVQLQLILSIGTGVG